MAESPATQKSSYPLPAYNFKVTVDGASESFSEVSGVNIEYETMTYRHGFSFCEGESITRWSYPKYTPISLKKGVVSKNSFLYDWISENSTSPRSMEIGLCDESGNPVVVWRIARAVPVKLEAPNFDAAASQVSIEKLDLMVSGVSILRP